MPFWFNVSTGQVEDDDNKSRGDDVMGPYETRDEASQALAQAAEKTKKWDDQDREWEEG
ncbi:MAG: methionine aminopeptidase [Micrococcales bacterium]|nr:methionine aminopeptidase [Micrococcales bacterium]